MISFFIIKNVKRKKFTYSSREIWEVAWGTIIYLEKNEVNGENKLVISLILMDIFLLKEILAAFFYNSKKKKKILKKFFFFRHWQKYIWINRKLNEK